MSIHGILFIDLLGLVIIGLIINLVRTHKLNVGYAVVWLLALIGLMITISFPPLLEFITRSVGAIYPASALSLLAFVFIFLVLIFFSIQISMISFRQNELIQYIALKDLSDEGKKTTKNDQGDVNEFYNQVREMET
jgi:hypothetical protein